MQTSTSASQTASDHRKTRTAAGPASRAAPPGLTGPPPGEAQPSSRGPRPETDIGDGHRRRGDRRRGDVGPSHPADPPLVVPDGGEAQPSLSHRPEPPPARSTATSPGDVGPSPEEEMDERFKTPGTSTHRRRGQ